MQKSLRTAGLVASSPTWSAARIARAALGVVGLIGIGVGIGVALDGTVRGGPRSHAAAEAPRADEKYLLLLYEGETFEDSVDTRQLRSEYAEWASALRDRGVTLEGEELEGEAILLEEPGTSGESLTDGGRMPPLGRLGGYFVISAADRTAALTIPAACPHLVHGGRIVVRSIVSTQGPRREVR